MSRMRAGDQDDEDFNEFESRVADVEATIKALMEGKLEPAEVDKKQEEIERKKTEAEERKIKKKEMQERQLRKIKRDQERKKWGFVGRWCPRCRKDEFQIFEEVHGKDDTKWPEKGPDHCTSRDCKALEVQIKLLTPEERREQLQARVEDMKKERLAKALARDRWNRWKSTQSFTRVGAEWEEKYNEWDKWLPSDEEEDELPPAPPPDTPEFKMMEKDIDDRAKDKAERRKKGEECKKKGNAFLEEGKLRSAFAQYTKGLESDKSSRALLLNRALCCLKLNNKKVTIEKLGEDVTLDSFQQCIDDCTKVLDICEFLHENEGPGIKQSRIKAHMRRAEAKGRLGLLDQALADIAEPLDPSHERYIKNLSAQEKQELSDLAAKFKTDKHTHDRVKRLRQMAGIAGTDISDTGISAKGAVEKDYADTAEGNSGETAEKKKMTQEKDQSHAHAAAAAAATTTTSQIKTHTLTPAPPPAAPLDRRGPVGGASSPLATGQRVAVWLDERREEEVEGVIAFDNGDGTWDIVLDDASDRDNVPRADIRCLEQAPSSAGAKVGGGTLKETREEGVRREEAVRNGEAEKVKKMSEKKEEASKGEGRPRVEHQEQEVQQQQQHHHHQEASEAATPKGKSEAPSASVPKDASASIAKAPAKAPASSANASPTIAKAAMRKVLVVHDDSEEEEEKEEAARVPAGGGKERQGSAFDARAFAEAMRGMEGVAGGPPALSTEADITSAAQFAERMQKVMGDPQIQKSLRNPRVQQVMAEVLAGAGSGGGGSAPTDKEVLSKYKDDPEVQYFYTKISSALEGVLSAPYPCDKAPPAPEQEKQEKKKQENPSEHTQKAQAGGEDAEVAAAQENARAAAKSARFGGLAQLDSAAMATLKGNPHLQAAMRDPNMLQKLHSLLQNPGGAEAAIAADAQLAALEDALMAALGGAPGGGGGAAPAGPGALAANSGSGSKGASAYTKPGSKVHLLTAEERLKRALAAVNSLQAALEVYVEALAEAKRGGGEEGQEGGEGVGRSVAVGSLCSEAREQLLLLRELVADDDVVALLLDQGGVDAVCSLAMALQASSSDEAEVVLQHALLVLQLVCVQEKCMVAVVAHGKGRTLVKMLACMQGVEVCGDAVVSAFAQLIEIALQHDSVRRTILKKTWSYVGKGGAAAGARVTLLSAAGAAATRAASMLPAIGCITNAAFEEHGKEQLLAHELSLPASAPAHASILQTAVRVADENPSGGAYGGSAPGMLRGKALRMLLNVTASGDIRTLIGKGTTGLGFLVRILEEQVGAGSRAKYSAGAAASALHGQEALSTTLGLLINLGLDDAQACELVAQGALVPLAALFNTCPWDSSLARGASGIARLVRLPQGARQARELGVLHALLEVLKKAAGSSAAEKIVPVSAAQGGERASDDGAGGDAKPQVLDPCVRALAQALRNDDASTALVREDMHALRALVAAVRCGREQTVGNAALALQMVANHTENLERLGKAGAVPALLNVVHHMRGPAQRNAALALARVVKREENLAVLKALHGLDILNCYLKLT